MPRFGIGYIDICNIKDFDMVEIHTLSAADFKHTMKSNDLYDCNIEQRTDVAVISIGNSFEDSEPDERAFVEVVPATAQECAESHIRRCFSFRD